MNPFYTRVVKYGNSIFHRGVDENGNRFTRKEHYTPSVYLLSKRKEDMKTLAGEPLEKLTFDSIYEYSDFLKEYSSITNYPIYGVTNVEFQFIGDNYSHEIHPNMEKIHVLYIDIETTCENGFPNVEDPEEQIIAITMICGDRTVVLGLGDYRVDHVESYSFYNEQELLSKFIELWKELDPDIITGWNVKFFDIPYLVRRIERLMGGKASSNLSPWNKIHHHEIKTIRGMQSSFDIIGISTLDYYDVYKKFTFVNQESYRLDNIAYVELGERKLSYDEFSNMREFYKKDFQKFIEYNIRDTELVKRLEEKLGLLELVITLAYSAKVNYPDTFSQTKTWDCIIYHYLRDQGIAVPPKKVQHKSEQYAGAYVKEPIVGMHDWVVSFDVSSMYPNLIVHYNISPETKVDVPEDFSFGFNVDAILSDKDTIIEKIEKLRSLNYTVPANCIPFRKDVQGFMPALMEKLYEERSFYKKKSIESKKELELLEKSDPKYREKQYEISRYNNIQMVRKIQLNSLYGAQGSPYFRFYDIDIAEAITLSGQLSIRWIANKINELLNNTLGTKNEDFVIASDTDSIYITMGKLVDRFCGKMNREQIIDYLDKASKELFDPFIEKCFDELTEKMNAYKNRMLMSREVIADKGLWTAKKRYILNVYDSDGVRYEKPKLKIMGIETTRSSTPDIVRKRLTETLQLVMNGNNDEVIKYIEAFRKEFYGLPTEAIAFPRGCNGMYKYSDRENIYTKNTPIAVKGSLLYNYHLKSLRLEKKYEPINEGEKVKFVYLKQPNPIRDRVISFPSILPKELDLQAYIDYDIQFEKAYLDPLKGILDCLGWTTTKVSTLEDLFA